MQSKDIIGDQIAFYIAGDEKDARSETASQIIRQAARARVAIFKTAPRDILMLEIRIAKKTRAFSECETLSDRDILQVELDTLKGVLAIVRMTLDHLALTLTKARERICKNGRQCCRGPRNNGPP